MKKTLGCIRKADTDFNLIEDGDHIAIGVSGGKDSLLLLHALSLYRKFTHTNFTMTAITVTMGLEPFDLSGISSLCSQLEIPYVIKETQIGEIIFEYRREKNPCVQKCAELFWLKHARSSAATNWHSGTTGKMCWKHCS